MTNAVLLKLKHAEPCPFCGKQPPFVFVPVGVGSAVSCDRCGAVGPACVSGVTSEALEGARMAWNRRPKQKAPDGEFEPAEAVTSCRFCGGTLHGRPRTCWCGQYTPLPTHEVHRAKHPLDMTGVELLAAFLEGRGGLGGDDEWETVKREINRRLHGGRR